MNEIEKREQELKVNFVKDLMKLPLNKKTNKIDLDDVKKSIDNICDELMKENTNIMKELIIISDKKIMEVLKKK